MYFCYFVIITPWKGQGPSFEQTWIPFTQRCFVPSLVEISPVVLEKKILKKNINMFSLFCNYLLLEKGVALHLNLLYPRIHCAKFGWNWPSDSWEDDENVKSLQTDKQTDRQTKSYQKSSLELSAQVSLKYSDEILKSSSPETLSQFQPNLAQCIPA